jgi:hypothetical protein
VAPLLRAVFVCAGALFSGVTCRRTLAVCCFAVCWRLERFFVPNIVQCSGGLIGGFKLGELPRLYTNFLREPTRYVYRFFNLPYLELKKMQLRELLDINAAELEVCDEWFPRLLVFLSCFSSVPSL